MITISKGKAERDGARVYPTFLVEDDLDSFRRFPKQVVGFELAKGTKFIIYSKFNNERKTYLCDVLGSLVPEKRTERYEREPSLWERAKAFFGATLYLESSREANINVSIYSRLNPYIKTVDNYFKAMQCEVAVFGVLPKEGEPVFYGAEVSRVPDYSVIARLGLPINPVLFNVKAKSRSTIIDACNRVFKKGKISSVLVNTDNIYAKVDKQ